MTAMRAVSPIQMALSGNDMPRSLFGYEVIDFLGEGAGSTMYAVSDPETRQVLALKHVVRKSERHARFIEQLETEHEFGQKANHPSLRRTYDFRCHRTWLRTVTDAVLVMELFDGMTLEQAPISSLDGFIDCFLQVSQAMQAMHQMGYVHCDMKPNNILVNHAGEVKVIDFGQACTIGTIKGRIQGTPDFIAPEQVRCDPVTERTDVFNLGATMYWALTGRNIPTLYTVNKKGENSFLVDSQFSTPTELNPQVPEALSNLIMECVRTNPLKRPADMAEVTRRLETISFGIKRASQSKRNMAVA